MTNSQPLRRHLCFLDVGHGNCTVLIAGDTDVIVIDVGQQSTLSEFLADQQVFHIQSIYLSHADADHIGALIGIIATKEVTIGRVFLNSDSSKDTDIWDDLVYELDAANRVGSLSFHVGLVSGTVETLSGNVQLEVLGPSPYLAAKGVGGTHKPAGKIRSNSISAVISIDVAGSRLVLLPGDLDGVGLEDLLAKCDDLHSAVLVYPHHGGLPGGMDPDKFTDSLLAAVSPAVVIFSIGRGRHATPNPAIIRTLRENFSDVRIICTQLSKHCAMSLPANPPTHLAPAFARGRAKGTCCGGTIVIPLDEPEGILPQLRPHVDFIHAHAETALCSQA